MIRSNSQKYIRRIRAGVASCLVLAIIIFANYYPRSLQDQIEGFARPFEFDYVSWTLGAFFSKASPAADAASYLTPEMQHAWVENYLEHVSALQNVEQQINLVYADPAQTDPAATAADLLEERSNLETRIDSLAPLVEAILQNQISVILAEMGFTTGGQPLPPVLYHTSPLPMALIISARDVIREDANLSLHPDLPLDEIANLEQSIESRLDVSALVVPVGGIATYPTMVMETTDLRWMIETICHEWMHNYLTLRPLGIRYDATPELRTMNETTASIAGTELGNAVLAAFYPERLPPPTPETTQSQSTDPAPQPTGFDFRAEMHRIRVLVDYLLEHGYIEQAERTMNQRREVFLENGYIIRRLNQAYFAFYGAYAEIPGGPAGEDPVGPAVRALREQSATLVDFIERIAAMTSFSELEAAVRTP